jgi:peptide/nickel transport system permease protein
LIVLYLFATLVFFGAQSILPGDFVSYYEFVLNDHQAEALRDELGLDQPLHQQYLSWLSHLVRGDLGHAYSATGRRPPVTEIIAGVLPATALVFGLGAALAFLFGHWLGKLSAWGEPKWLGGTISFGAVALHTSFPPWLAFLIVYIFIARLGWFDFPSARAGFQRPDISQPEVMGLMMFSLLALALLWIMLASLLFRRRRIRTPLFLGVLITLISWLASWHWMDIFPFAVEILYQAAVPLITFSLLIFGEVTFITRLSLEDARFEDYVITARAKGLSERQVRDRHAARTSLLPVVSKMLVQLPYLLTGIVMIEHMVGWGGIGAVLTVSLGTQDAPTLMGMVLTIGLIALIARIALDLILLGLDPRLRAWKWRSFSPSH